MSDNYSSISPIWGNRTPVYQNKYFNKTIPNLLGSTVDSGITLNPINTGINTAVTSNTPTTQSSPVNWDNFKLNTSDSTGSGLNFYDAPTMSKYGYGTTFGQDYYNQYGSPTQKTGWFGNTSTQYDMGTLADRMIADSPMLAEQVKSWTPEQYNLWRSDPTKYNYSNVNAMQTQLDAALKNQQNNQWTAKDTMGAIQSGIGVATSLANLYMGFKQQKLAEQQMKETLALQRANYRNNAKAMNAQYRDQLSGRGTTVMSGSAKRKLGQMYANRKIAEDY